MSVFEFVFGYLMIGVLFASFLMGFAGLDRDQGFRRNYMTTDAFATLIILWPIGVVMLTGAFMSHVAHKLLECDE